MNKVNIVNIFGISTLMATGSKAVENPFLEGMESYIDSMFGICSASTIIERGRKLRYIARIFSELHTEGKIQNLVPANITVKDLQMFVHWMRTHDLDVATQQKYLQIVNGYFQFNDNNAVITIRTKLKLSVPRKPIKSLTVEEMGKIFKTVEAMKGWRGSIARGMIYLAFQTLGRPSEIRTAELKDLDMIKQRLYIRNPKGKGTVASGQWVDLLRPDFMRHIEKYLAEREIYLVKKGRKSEYLFPNFYMGEDGFYSSNAQRKLIREISCRSGIEFSMKTLRATGTDLFVSADMSNIYPMSAQLRHSDVSITQRYYADIQRGNVRNQLGDSYKSIRIPTDDED